MIVNDERVITEDKEYVNVV